ANRQATQSGAVAIVLHGDLKPEQSPVNCCFSLAQSDRANQRGTQARKRAARGSGQEHVPFEGFASRTRSKGLNERLTAPPFYLPILIYGSGFAPWSIDVRFTPKSRHR